MLAKRKKIGKKQIKEDKLVTGYYKTIEFYEEYKNQILIGVAAVVVIIAAIVFWSGKTSEEDILASQALSKVMPIYDSGSYKEAIEGRPGTEITGLQNIVDEFGGTKSGQLAKIYLANSYLYIGETEKALDAYSSYSGGDPLFQATAFAGEAACYEVKGELEKAAEKYKKAAFTSEANPLHPQYLLFAAKNYIKVGGNDEAKRLLNRVKENFERTNFARDAEKFVAMID